MRFLTAEWATGGLSDEEWDRRWLAFQEHQRTVLPLLGAGAEHLVQDVNLHDAVPKDCMVDEPTVELRFVAGDLRRGYEFVHISYSEAHVSGATVADVRRWLADPSAEILYDEVDVEEGRFVHRYLVHPGREFDVRFSGVEVRRLPAQPSDR